MHPFSYAITNQGSHSAQPDMEVMMKYQSLIGRAGAFGPVCGDCQSLYPVGDRVSSKLSHPSSLSSSSTSS